MMAKPALVSSRPPRSAKVIVFEDHGDLAEGMCTQLISHGMVAHSVDNLTQFVDTLKHETYDVASVDWDINGVAEGQTALARLKDLKAGAARVVYSVFADDRTKQRARSKGADFFLEKRVGQSEEDYLKTIFKAAQLGLARRVAGHLKALRRWRSEIGAPQSPDVALDPEIENNLCQEGRKYLFDAAVAGEEKGEMLELMKRRGWWYEFDRRHYAELPMQGKFAELATHLRLTQEDIATILGADNDVTLSLFNQTDQIIAVDSTLLKQVDRLLSVFAYVLRIARYEPEMMHYYWTVTGLFQKSSSRPPWDNLGFRKYLIGNGNTGINESLYWIRRH